MADVNSAPRDITRLEFGIANPADIRKFGVVKVVTSAVWQGSNPVAGGVNDVLLGPTQPNTTCPTCQNSIKDCPSHYGYADLIVPVYLTQFMEPVHHVLKSVCYECSHLIRNPADLPGYRSKLSDLSKLMENQRCYNCGKSAMKYTRKKAFDEFEVSDPSDPDSQPSDLTATRAHEILARISGDTLSFLGFSETNHPSWMVPDVLLIAPPAIRPAVIQDGKRSEDDITVAYVNFLKSHIGFIDERGKPDADANRLRQLEIIRQTCVKIIMDNSSPGQAQATHNRNSAPLVTLIGRLKGKGGRFRGNLMGKRVDFSGRTVITPDPSIDLREVGVPLEICMDLTVPEVVNQYNRKRLQTSIENGPNTFPGAKTVTLLNGQTIDLRIKPNFIADYGLPDGFIVNRHLNRGDIVLMNRQPSLHRMSMMAFRVFPLPGKSFRLNPSACKPFNADFDGDEMNMHVPRSIQASTELALLASVEQQMISPRDNKIIISLIQDSLSGSYKLTAKNSRRIPDHIAMNLLARWGGSGVANGDGAGTHRVPSRSRFRRRPEGWTGLDLLHETVLPVWAERKQITGGYLSKSSVGLFHRVWKDVGPNAAAQLLNEIQSLIQRYLMFDAFSVGINDIVMAPESDARVKASIETAYRDVEAILQKAYTKWENTTGRTNAEEVELAIQQAYKKVENAALEEVKKLHPDNRIMYMVNSGAKASKMNVMQMSATLGQQVIDGGRMKPGSSGHTLPQFPRYDLSLDARGFIDRNFLEGLKPHQFVAHQMAGRGGLIETAVKTAETGYMQRQMMKMMEDHKIATDFTVRGANNGIIQFRYGDDGIDSCATELQEINLHKLSGEDIEREFGLTTIQLEILLSPEAFSKLTTPIQDGCDRLRADRDSLIQNVFAGKKPIEDVIAIPVYLTSIIAARKNNSDSQTDLLPETVLASLDAWLTQTPNALFGIALRFMLAPKRCIVDYRWSEAVFKTVLTEISWRYRAAFVHVGEAVGPIAAQSLGEPSTQLTLNVFHSAGTAKANSTSGVPRLRELMRVSETKTPSNFIVPRAATGAPTASVAPNGAPTLLDAQNLRNELVSTTIADLNPTISVYYDPSDDDTAIPEDITIIPALQSWNSPTANSTNSPLLVRLEFDRAVIESRGLTMEAIAIRLAQNERVAVESLIASDTNISPDLPLVMRLRLEIANPRGAQAYWELREAIASLEKTLLSDVEGISRVYIRDTSDLLYYDAAEDIWRSDVAYVMDTDGANLAAVLGNPNVDIARTTSNHVPEVEALFGIEAARQVTLNEIIAVMNNAGINGLNHHHLSLVVDSMAVTGKLLGIDRHGMSKNADMGPLAKASFETPDKQMVKSAVLNESDYLNGVSSNIMVGQRVPVGTGSARILLDHSGLPEPAESPLDPASIGTTDALELGLRAPPEPDLPAGDWLADA